jgi:hypothetical protein
MRRALLASLVLLVACTSPSKSDTIGQLLNWCEDFEQSAKTNGTQISLTTIGAGECYGYFTAIHTLAFLHLSGSAGSLPNVCMPNGPTKMQLIRIFIKYARDNPQDQHQDAIFGVLTALFRAFPCKE